MYYRQYNYSKYRNESEFMDVTWWSALSNLTGGQYGSDDTDGNAWYDGDKKKWYPTHTEMYFTDKSDDYPVEDYPEYGLGYLYFAVTILTETGDQELNLKAILKKDDFEDMFTSVLKDRLKYYNYSYYDDFKITKIYFENTGITTEQRAKSMCQVSSLFYLRKDNVSSLFVVGVVESIIDFSIMVAICAGILLFTVIALHFYDKTGKYTLTQCYLFDNCC